VDVESTALITVVEHAVLFQYIQVVVPVMRLVRVRVVTEMQLREFNKLSEESQAAAVYKTIIMDIILDLR
jgi:hypothetical protein